MKKKVARSFSKKIQDSMHLDQMILDLAAGPYKQILKQIEKSKIKLDQESRVALLLGSRILEKARLVRDQLVQQAQKVPGVAYVAQKTARDKSVKRLKSKRQTTLRKTTRKVAPKKSLKSV